MRLLFIFIFILACGRTDDQEKESAIREARYYLSSMECTKALESLDEVDFDEKDADYISTYASTQACFGGYKELDVLFGGNLESLNASSLLGSLSSFTSSNEETAESSTYIALNNAITILLGFDGTNDGSPDTATRTAKFGTKKAGDLSLQALYHRVQNVFQVELK